MTEILNVVEYGTDGGPEHPPLVLAHGLFGSARNFNTLGRKLAADRLVVLVDMRNHGDSPWADDVSYPAMAGDLARVIDAHCGGRALVLGHSMGGKAAMALALAHPDRVAGAIIADIAPVSYTHSHLPFIVAMRAVDLGAVKRRSDADPLLADAIPDPALRLFILQNLMIDAGTARWRLNLAALQAGMPDLLGWPGTLDSDPFRGPSLFLSGGNSDYMTPLLEPRVREVFPAASFQTISGAGHWLHAEKPVEFHAALVDWLDVHG